MIRRYLASVVVAMGLVALVLLLRAVRPVEAQGPAASAAAPAAATPWGDPDLQGIWTRGSEEPLQRPAKFADKEFFTDEERAAIDKQRADIISRDASKERRTIERQGFSRAGRRAAPTTPRSYTSHLRLGRRTAMIVDPPNGRLPPLRREGEEEQAELRAYSLALKQATDVCKNNRPACAGGKYGPEALAEAIRDARLTTSRATAVCPAVAVACISRSDGPEDRGHGERCMSSALPDFGGFRRIVQSRGHVSIFYDTGQGQGWHRTIPITSGAASSFQAFVSGGGTRAAVGKARRSSST